ncbi:MAG: hypothetical protein KF718_15370 [Polyangiaceae bacterium]|nr:hypothetical protein [Polyangiaceae bacterium]
MSLAPLTCPRCGSHVAVSLGAATRCRHCATELPIPELYRSAQAKLASAVELRRRVEVRWRRMTAQASWWTEWVAAALMLFLPPLAAVLAVYVVWFPLAMLDGLVFVATPAILPGGILWVWAIASRATAARINAELLARAPSKPGGDPACRACGAPLAVDPEAFAATCLYCGTDSLVTGALAAERHGKLGEKVRTLREALSAWRWRVLLFGVGFATLTVPLFALVVLLWMSLGLAV